MAKKSEAKAYKHSTRTFGDSGEYYCSQLYMMFNNPNGFRRPDLISINGYFNPRMSMEVKSGGELKGMLVDYQLHYPISSKRDYEEVLGESFPQTNENLLGSVRELPEHHIAYYYNVIHRNDGLHASDMNTPFSSIKLTFGDQFLVPHEWVFHAYAIDMHRKTGKPFEEVVKSLKEVIKQDILMGGSNYEERKKDANSLQNLYSRDIKAYYMEDMSIATKDGKERIELLKRWYPAIEDLVRVQIPGPNVSQIYVMANKDELDLIDVQMRRMVEKRTSLVECLSQERVESISLLSKMSYVKVPTFAATPDVKPKFMLHSDLTIEDIRKLRRLVKWRPEGHTDIGLEDGDEDDFGRKDAFLEMEPAPF